MGTPAHRILLACGMDRPPRGLLRSPSPHLAKLLSQADKRTVAHNDVPLPSQALCPVNFLHAARS
jgi:hypothetical protein